MKRKFRPGDCVRLTAKFLQNTGQYVGGEGRKKWTVVADPGCFMCQDGGYVAVNEDAMYQDEDEPTRPRHIAVTNLIKCKSPDYSGL